MKTKSIKNIKFNFVGNLKYLIIAPIVIALVGIILLLTVGFNTGIDFTGGTVVNIVLGEQLNDNTYYAQSVDKVEDVLNNHGLKISVVQLSETELGDALAVRYQDKSNLNENQINELNALIKIELLETFGFDPNIVDDAAKVQDSQHIGATASSELLTKAFIGILAVIVAVLIYIALRFEFTSGMAAVLSVFHDLIIMSSLMLMFRIQINSSFIAALITVVGYSINNTIIIFDRIRENAKNSLMDKLSTKNIANQSIKETLTRTFFTTGTTLITVVMLAIFGTSSIQEFVLPIIFGLLAGVYSSTCLAPGLWSIAYVGRNKRNKIVKPQTEIAEQN